MKVLPQSQPVYLHQRHTIQRIAAGEKPGAEENGNVKKPKQAQRPPEVKRSPETQVAANLSDEEVNFIDMLFKGQADEPSAEYGSHIKQEKPARLGSHIDVSA